MAHLHGIDQIRAPLVWVVGMPLQTVDQKRRGSGKLNSVGVGLNGVSSGIVSDMVFPWRRQGLRSLRFNKIYPLLFFCFGIHDDDFYSCPLWNGSDSIPSIGDHEDALVMDIEFRIAASVTGCKNVASLGVTLIDLKWDCFACAAVVGHGMYPGQRHTK
jgi:hypothetical protein